MHIVVRIGVGDRYTRVLYADDLSRQLGINSLCLAVRKGSRAVIALIETPVGHEIGEGLYPVREGLALGDVEVDAYFVEKALSAGEPDRLVEIPAVRDHSGIGYQPEVERHRDRLGTAPGHPEVVAVYYDLHDSSS